MAEQPHNQQPPATDPVTAFWRDVWAKMAPAAPTGFPGMGSVPGAAPMPSFNPFMTPDMAKRMQSAFFDAMAQSAEQFMRSPQFLDSMKKSMDQALQFRRQMDDFLKLNMAESFEAATGGANAELLGAIRHLERTVTGRLDELNDRVDNLEGKGKPATPSSPASNSKRSRASSNRR